MAPNPNGSSSVAWQSLNAAFSSIQISGAGEEVGDQVNTGLLPGGTLRGGPLRGSPLRGG